MKLELDGNINIRQNIEEISEKRLKEINTSILSLYLFHPSYPSILDNSYMCNLWNSTNKLKLVFFSM